MYIQSREHEMDVAISTVLGPCHFRVTLSPCFSLQRGQSSMQFHVSCSSEGTEYWCGGCTLPLAMVLPDEEVQNHRPAFRGEDGGEFVVSRPCEKTITMPIEPKVHTLCALIGVEWDIYKYRWHCMEMYE